MLASRQTPNRQACRLALALSIQADSKASAPPGSASTGRRSTTRLESRRCRGLAMLPPPRKRRLKRGNRTGIDRAKSRAVSIPKADEPRSAPLERIAGGGAHHPLRGMRFPKPAESLTNQARSAGRRQRGANHRAVSVPKPTGPKSGRIRARHGRKSNRLLGEFSCFL